MIPKPESRASCPTCGAPATVENRPFCSRRCADVDLHRWLGGVYRVETDEEAENFEAEVKKTTQGG